MPSFLYFLGYTGIPRVPRTILVRFMRHCETISFASSFAEIGYATVLSRTVCIEASFPVTYKRMDGASNLQAQSTSNSLLWQGRGCDCYLPPYYFHVILINQCFGFSDLFSDRGVISICVSRFFHLHAFCLSCHSHFLF